MILVTGATGHFGGLAIDFLLKKGVPASDIAALVRDESKASSLKEQGVQIRTGNYDDKASLEQALKGVDKVLLVSGTDLEQRDTQHQHVVEAAKTAGVKQIAYTSIDRTDDEGLKPLGALGASHLFTERIIKESGIPYTLLLNNIYMDYVPVFLGEHVLQNGLFFPAGEGRVAFGTRAEMAEAAATVLAESGHENKSYHISNSEAVSFSEIAEILSGIAGKALNYTSPEPQVFVDTLVSFGVPQPIADMSAGFGEAMKQNILSGGNSDLERLIGRKPQTAASFLKAFYQQR